MKNTINLLFAGDFIPPENTDTLFSDELRNILEDKDFSIVNLETPLTLGKNKIEKTGNNFKRPPSFIRYIREGYFNAVTLSNNHIRDYSDEGVNETLKTCQKNDILTVGAGRNIGEAIKPLRLNIKGKKISLLNYSEQEFNIATENRAGANPFDLIDAFFQIQAEKEKNDFVIVIYHGGLEYQYYPTLEMVKNFKFMIEIGADVIVGHHTHRYSGAIRHDTKPIIFGLGNFVCSTTNKISNEWLTGLIAKIILKDDTIDFELVPIKMTDDCDRLNLIKSTNAEKVLNHIDEISSSILDQYFLTNYWIEKDFEEKDRIIRLLKSDSRIEYRFRKYFPRLFRTRLSTYKRSILLNMIRCDSHRNRLIRILEKTFT